MSVARVTRIIRWVDDRGRIAVWTRGMTKIHSTSPTLTRTFTAIGLAAVGLTLAGCSAVGVNGQVGAEYSTYAAAQKSDEQFRIPKLIPRDAEKIRLQYNTVKSGTVFAFESPGGITAGYCAAGRIEDPPANTAKWLPHFSTPRDGTVCGDWYVAEKDGVFYAWDLT